MGLADVILKVAKIIAKVIKFVLECVLEVIVFGMSIACLCLVYKAPQVVKAWNKKREERRLKIIGAFGWMVVDISITTPLACLLAVTLYRIPFVCSAACGKPSSGKLFEVVTSHTGKLIADMMALPPAIICLLSWRCIHVTRSVLQANTASERRKIVFSNAFKVLVDYLLLPCAFLLLLNPIRCITTARVLYGSLGGLSGLDDCDSNSFDREDVKTARRFFLLSSILSVYDCVVSVLCLGFALAVPWRILIAIRAIYILFRCQKPLSCIPHDRCKSEAAYSVFQLIGAIFTIFSLHRSVLVMWYTTQEFSFHLWWKVGAYEESDLFSKTISSVQADHVESIKAEPDEVIPGQPPTEIGGNEDSKMPSESFQNREMCEPKFEARVVNRVQELHPEVLNALTQNAAEQLFFTISDIFALTAAIVMLVLMPWRLFAVIVLCRDTPHTISCRKALFSLQQTFLQFVTAPSTVLENILSASNLSKAGFNDCCHWLLSDTKVFPAERYSRRLEVELLSIFPNSSGAQLPSIIMDAVEEAPNLVLDREPEECVSDSENDEIEKIGHFIPEKPAEHARISESGATSLPSEQDVDEYPNTETVEEQTAANADGIVPERNGLRSQSVAEDVDAGRNVGSPEVSQTRLEDFHEGVSSQQETNADDRVALFISIIVGCYRVREILVSRWCRLPHNEGALPPRGHHPAVANIGKIELHSGISDSRVSNIQESTSLMPGAEDSNNVSLRVQLIINQINTVCDMLLMSDHHDAVFVSRSIQSLEEVMSEYEFCFVDDKTVRSCLEWTFRVEMFAWRGIRKSLRPELPWNIFPPLSQIKGIIFKMAIAGVFDWVAISLLPLCMILRWKQIKFLFSLEFCPPTLIILNQGKAIVSLCLDSIRFLVCIATIVRLPHIVSCTLLLKRFGGAKMSALRHSTRANYSLLASSLMKAFGSILSCRAFGLFFTVCFWLIFQPFAIVLEAVSLLSHGDSRRKSDNPSQSSVTQCFVFIVASFPVAVGIALPYIADSSSAGYILVFASAIAVVELLFCATSQLFRNQQRLLPPGGSAHRIRMNLTNLVSIGGLMLEAWQWMSPSLGFSFAVLDGQLHAGTSTSEIRHGISWEQIFWVVSGAFWVFLVSGPLAVRFIIPGNPLTCFKPRVRTGGSDDAKQEALFKQAWLSLVSLFLNSLLLGCLSTLFHQAMLFVHPQDLSETSKFWPSASLIIIGLMSPSVGAFSLYAFPDSNPASDIKWSHASTTIIALLKVIVSFIAAVWSAENSSAMPLVNGATMCLVCVIWCLVERAKASQCSCAWVSQLRLGWLFTSGICSMLSGAFTLAQLDQSVSLFAVRITAMVGTCLAVLFAIIVRRMAHKRVHDVSIADASVLSRVVPRTIRACERIIVFCEHVTPSESVAKAASVATSVSSCLKDGPLTSSQVRAACSRLLSVIPSSFFAIEAFSLQMPSMHCPETVKSHVQTLPDGDPSGCATAVYWASLCLEIGTGNCAELLEVMPVMDSILNHTKTPFRNEAATVDESCGSLEEIQMHAPAIPVNDMRQI